MVAPVMGRAPYLVDGRRSGLEPLKLAGALLFHAVVQWKLVRVIPGFFSLLAKYDVDRKAVRVSNCDQPATTRGVIEGLDVACSRKTCSPF